MHKKRTKLFKLGIKQMDLFKLHCVEPICKGIPDKLYLQLKFWIKMRRKLDLTHPQTFNEKIQWLKLYDQNPLYTEIVDKYEVRKHIERAIGDKFLIPLVGVWDDFEEIDFEALPDRFVLKCNHDSGGVVVCNDKVHFDIADARKKINKRLARNYYHSGREWPYKNIQPRIICEDLIEPETGGLPNDYKFHCFNGKARNVMV